MTKQHFATVGVVLVFVAIAMVWFAQRATGEAAPNEVQLTALTLPSSVPAGTIVTIEAVAAESSGVSTVVISAGYGQLEFDMVINAGVGSLNLPAAVTQHAGVITVASGNVVTELTIEPIEVHELVAPLVGPRTIVADGQDESLAVMLPIDRYGNQVADGTAVNVEWQQPEGTDQVRTETADGMAWVPVQSGLTAGPTTVRSTASSSTGEIVSSAAVRIDEVPGRVETIELDASTSTALADGRTIIEVETGTLVDEHGNELMDGTVAQLVFMGPSGSGVLPATVQNGVVRVDLVAPDQPGTLTASVHVHGEVSSDITIDFASAIESYEVRLESVGPDVVLRVERALDPSGAFIADGTELRWGNEQAQLRHGAAEIWLPAALLETEIPMVEILGLEADVEQES